MTHVEALELDVIPEHLLIMGGGYIGLEFTEAMRRFGRRVTLIVRNDRLLPLEDEDVSTGIRALLVDEGVEILFNTNVTSVSREAGKHVVLTLVQDGEKQVVEGSVFLSPRDALPIQKTSAWKKRVSQ